MKEPKPLMILVVEDEPLHQRAARYLLREHRVTVADSFVEASHQKDKIFDVVLTDFMLPYGKYCNTYEQLRRSGLSIDEAEEYCRKPQPFGYPIALIAAKRRPSVRHIGIVTDTNHHNSAGAEAIGYLTSTIR